MVEIEVDDIATIYKNSVVLYKNKPVYVEQVFPDGTVNVTDLLTQRNRNVAFSLVEFKPLTRRIGFINFGGSVVYGYRVPVRKYKVGLSVENIKLHTIDANYPLGKGVTKERIAGLRSPELGDALFDRYPTFQEALEQVQKVPGAIAFDKQFCITSEFNVFYKTKKVGTVARTAKSPADIKFGKGNEHLSILLENNHEKDISTAR